MKGKSVFVLNSVIVIAFAVLAVVAFVYSLSKMLTDEISKRVDLKAEGIMESEYTIEPERNMTEELHFPEIRVGPQDMMKILMVLLCVGSIIFTQIRSKNLFQAMAGIAYALAIAFLLGKWGIYMACVERGYEAAGGEYCLVFIAGQTAGRVIERFFDILEDYKNGRACGKEGS